MREQDNGDQQLAMVSYDVVWHVDNYQLSKCYQWVTENLTAWLVLLGGVGMAIESGVALSWPRPDQGQGNSSPVTSYKSNA